MKFESVEILCEDNCLTLQNCTVMKGENFVMLADDEIKFEIPRENILYMKEHVKLSWFSICIKSSGLWEEFSDIVFGVE